MNKSIKFIFNFFLAPVLFILLCFSLYHQISQQPDLPRRWHTLSHNWNQPLFYVVVGMMLLNYGLEARKWQLQVAPLEKLSFFRAFKSVMAGCSITLMVPNRMGEYGGRILFVSEGNRARAVSLTVLGSIAQLIITLLMGVVGIIVIKFFATSNIPVSERLPFVLEDVLLAVSILLVIFLLWVYFKVNNWVSFLERFKIISGIVKYITVLHSVSRKTLLRILSISFFRYLVFILQYIWLLQVTDVDIPLWSCFWIISVFYLVMAVVPTIGFVELPLRAVASVGLLSAYSDNVLGIQAAALGIWIINLVLPAIIGSLLIFGVKVLKEK
ncbi:MAG: flippase-like domain-containing protein [Ferruginibacter sp.]|nr:flippase-like domain-containing protein [Ferruginibacter sp.]